MIMEIQQCDIVEYCYIKSENTNNYRKPVNGTYKDWELKSDGTWVKVDYGNVIESAWQDFLSEKEPLKTVPEEHNQCLCDDTYWRTGEWKQPPVKIKHGDLVDIKHEKYSATMLGRYIGKGYGVVELFNYATGVEYIVGKVVTRGLGKNPRLISDEKLFEFIKD